ncbi:MAG: HupE/UreJ family protein [Paracoccaceae bacterium]
MRIAMSRAGRRKGIFGSLLGYLIRLTSLCLLSSGIWTVGSSYAHEVTPTIADMSVSEDRLILTLRLNIEGFIAGIDLDGVADTDETGKAADYDLLRGLSAQELDPMVRAFTDDWLAELKIATGQGSVTPVLDSVMVPEAGDIDLPRASQMILSAHLPENTSAISLHWPVRSGGLVLRQQGVEDPYTGYLQGGETSPVISLKGGAALSAFEVFRDYIPVGFEHILPKGLDHILFVLGLFFLSARLRPLVWQISAFTLAHTITLALSVTGWVQVPAEIVEPLIAASIVYVAVENIVTNRLQASRTLLVFCFGLLHGLGFASVLTEFGLPQNQLFAALAGFNIGVELGQLTVIMAAWLLIGAWFGRHPKYRGRFAMPASFTIALIGAYWFVQRVSGF